MAPSQDEQVKALPDIELDGENLVDDDSDMEETTQEKKEHAIEAQKPRIHCTFRMGSGKSSQKHSSFLACDGLGIIWVGFGGLLRAQPWASASQVPPPMEATKKLKPKRTLAPPPQPLAEEPWLIRR